MKTIAQCSQGAMNKHKRNFAYRNLDCRFHLCFIQSQASSIIAHCVTIRAIVNSRSLAKSSVEMDLPARKRRISHSNSAFIQTDWARNSGKNIAKREGELFFLILLQRDQCAKTFLSVRERLCLVS